MKIVKIKFLIGLVLVVVIGYGVWIVTSGNGDLPKEIAFLNAKYELLEAVPVVEDAENEFYASLLQADSFKSYSEDPQRESQDIIIKLDSGQEPNLENLVILRLQTDEEIVEVAGEYAQIDGITYAEPDYNVELSEDEEGEEENVDDGGSGDADDESHELVDGSVKKTDREDILVAVIDSGVDVNHKGLRDRLVEGMNFVDEGRVDNESEMTDEEGHGTHVAGIVLNNSDNAFVMPIKFTAGKSAKVSKLIKAVKYAADNDTDVINLSVGLAAESKSLKEAIEYAVDEGVVVVAAAGNNNSDEKYFPAAWKNVLAVAAVNSNGEKTYISNYGDWIDFSALGEDVYSTIPGGEYAYKTGTSQAAPVLSAKIADYFGGDEVGENFDRDEDTEDLYKDVVKYLQEHSKKAKGEYAEELGEII